MDSSKIWCRYVILFDWVLYSSYFCGGVLKSILSHWMNVFLPFLYFVIIYSAIAFSVATVSICASFSKVFWVFFFFQCQHDIGWRTVHNGRLCNVQLHFWHSHLLCQRFPDSPDPTYSHHSRYCFVRTVIWLADYICQWGKVLIVQVAWLSYCQPVFLILYSLFIIFDHMRPIFDLFWQTVLSRFWTRLNQSADHMMVSKQIF